MQSRKNVLYCMYTYVPQWKTNFQNIYLKLEMEPTALTGPFDEKQNLFSIDCLFKRRTKWNKLTQMLQLQDIKFRRRSSLYM